MKFRMQIKRRYNHNECVVIIGSARDMRATVTRELEYAIKRRIDFASMNIPFKRTLIDANRIDDRYLMTYNVESPDRPNVRVVSTELGAGCIGKGSIEIDDRNWVTYTVEECNE